MNITDRGQPLTTNGDLGVNPPAAGGLRARPPEVGAFLLFSKELNLFLGTLFCYFVILFIYFFLGRGASDP